MFKHILVPTDGSGFRSKRSRRFIRCKGSRRADNGVLCQARVPGHLLRRGALIDRRRPKFAELAEEQSRQVLGFVEGVCRESGVDCAAVDDQRRPYGPSSQPPRKSGCDLIFMASHGRRGIGSLLLGAKTNRS